jgi:hypothetical protein
VEVRSAVKLSRRRDCRLAGLGCLSRTRSRGDCLPGRACSQPWSCETSLDHQKVFARRYFVGVTKVKLIEICDALL